MEELEFNTDFVVVLSAVIMMFLGMQSRKSMPPKFSYKAASPLRRFIRGVFVGLYDSLILFAIVAIGAYLGVVHLVGGAILLCLSIIGFVILVILGFISLLF